LPGWAKSVNMATLAAIGTLQFHLALALCYLFGYFLTRWRPL